MQYCDLTDSVTAWSSEEVVIPYVSPIDNKIHRYFVDFWIKTLTEQGKEEYLLIEIKPKKKTVKPVIAEQKMTKTKLIEMRDWMINLTKWQAAENFCKDRGWKFKILTEEDIFGYKPT